jgi:hypothetical protein
MQRNEFIDQANKEITSLICQNCTASILDYFYRNSVFLSPSNKQALTFYKYNR